MRLDTWCMYLTDGGLRMKIIIIENDYQRPLTVHMFAYAPLSRTLFIYNVGLSRSKHLFDNDYRTNIQNENDY